jgi:hypothetical protein
MNTELNLPVPEKVGNFLTSEAITSFSKRTLLRAVKHVYMRQSHAWQHLVVRIAPFSAQQNFMSISFMSTVMAISRPET